MDKDLRYFLGLAEELQQPTPLAALVRSQYQTASQNGWGKLDFAAVCNSSRQK